MDFKEMEETGWAEPATAQSYARAFSQVTEMVVPALVEEVQVAPACQALDLCCGHGIVSEGLIKAGAKVTALDFSPAMLELARVRAPDARLVQGDAGNLPLDAGRFDCVAMGFGMPHLPDPPAAMAEVRRVLRIGGRFAYSVWKEDPISALTYIFKAAAQFGSKTVSLPPGPGIHDYADPTRAFAAMEAAGFGDLSIRDVASTFCTDDPAAPYDLFLEGTVRGAALLRAQPTDNQMEIRQATIKMIEANHGTKGPWVVPMPSVVISGTAM